MTSNNNSVAIHVNVTANGCYGNPWSGLTTFIGGNWIKVKYTQEFRGSTLCWQIFGASAHGRCGSQLNI